MKPRVVARRKFKKVNKNKIRITDEIEIDHYHSKEKFQRNKSKPPIVNKGQKKFLKMRKS